MLNSVDSKEHCIAYCNNASNSVQIVIAQAAVTTLGLRYLKSHVRSPTPRIFFSWRL